MIVKLSQIKTAAAPTIFNQVGQRIKTFAQKNIKEIPTGVALAGGIALADAGTEAAFAKPGERKNAAIKGLAKGALYGTILAGVEPFIRRPLAAKLGVPA